MYSGLLDLPWWGYVLATLGMTHVTIVSITIYLHRQSGAPGARPASRAGAFLPVLALAHHGDRDRGVGGGAPQASRLRGVGGGSAQPEDLRHQEAAAGGGRAVPGRRGRSGDHRQVQPRVSGRLARAQRLQAAHRPWLLPHADHRRRSSSGPSASPSGRFRWPGSRSSRPGSSTASAIGGGIGTTRRRTSPPTSCPGASSSAARSSTTTTTRSQAPRSCRSRRGSSTSDGCTSASSSSAASPGSRSCRRRW